MNIVEGFEFYPLTFDEKGALTSRKELDGLVQRIADGPASDVILIAHGFRNDVAEATTLYTDFLHTLRGHMSRAELESLNGRRFAVAGVFWPSKQFPEGADDPSPASRGVPARARGRRPSRVKTPRVSPAKARTAAMDAAKASLADLASDATPAVRKKLARAVRLLPRLEGSVKAQDEFVKLVLSLLSRSTLDGTEGLPQIRKRRGSEVLGRLGGAGSGERGFGDVLSTITGGVGQFLNLTTWYVMKDRSGNVGAKGVASAVRKLHESRSETRIHLVGHSLGGRLMASCAKALCAAPALRPDSLMLLEAAFSHFGFSPDNGHGEAGFFRNVITKQIVRGPFVSTFSAQDTVVGHAYAITSRLAGDNTKELGDASDEFGGIGRNGPLRTPEVATTPMHSPGAPYSYTLGVINNLDASGGFIKDHSDVTNAAVTYAFASALTLT